MKKRIGASVAVWGLLLMILIPAKSVPLRKHAYHQSLRLFGGIVTADETGPLWGEELPEGWVWVQTKQKPGKYDFDLGQILPQKISGRIVFRVSRWHFVNTALQDGFSEEYTAQKLKKLAEIPVIQFKEDLETRDFRKEFESIDLSRAEELMTEPRRDIDFSISAKGAFVLLSTRKKVWKVYGENYSTSGTLSAWPADGSGQKQVIYVRNLENGWKIDLDEDGLVDLIWNPISHLRSSYFQVGTGHKIALYKIFGR